MSGTLLHRAPSHQPPPPSASKSRSRASCYNDSDDGVPALHLSTAHHRGAVTEVEVRQPHHDPLPNPIVELAVPSVARTDLSSYTALFHPAYPHGAVHRSRLDAEEDALLDSLSYSEVTASLNTADVDGIKAALGNRDEDSIVFDGQDDSMEASSAEGNGVKDARGVYHNSDVASASFCMPSEGAGGAAQPNSSADRSPDFYQEEKLESESRGADEARGSRSMQAHAVDRTATPRGTLHMTAHRPLDVAVQSEYTSRKLVFSASAMLTSPMEASAQASEEIARKTSHRDSFHGLGPSGCMAVETDDSEKEKEEEEESASSPQLHHHHEATDRGHTTEGTPHARLHRMAPLIPPPPVKDSRAVEGDSDNSREHSVSSAVVHIDQMKKSHLPASSPLPPTPHEDLDRADAAMESAMKEMAARLRSHERGAAGGADPLRSGAVLSTGNSPSTLHSSAASSPHSLERPQHRVGLSSTSDTPDEPHILHARDAADLVHDPEDVMDDDDNCDLVRSVRDGDFLHTYDTLLPRRRPLIESPGDDEREAAERHAAAAAYTFFSTELPLPEDRRARIQSLAKILKEGEALLTSPLAPTSNAMEEADEEAHRMPESAALVENEHMKRASLRRREPPPPPSSSSPHRTTHLASPPAVSATSPEASLFFEETMLHSMPASVPQTPQPPTPPVESLFGSGEGVNVSASSVVASQLNAHDCVNTGVAAGEHPASKDDVAAVASLTSSSLMASTTMQQQQHQRRPPRMLCPPTPSPSKSPSTARADGLPLAQQGSEEHDNDYAAVVQAVTEEELFETAPGHVTISQAHDNASAASAVKSHALIAATEGEADVAPFFTAVSTGVHAATSSAAPVSRPSPDPAAIVSDGDIDSTASLLTASSAQEEKNDRNPFSVLCGPTEVSICAAEEEVPIPLSPRCEREPSLSSQLHAASMFAESDAAITGAAAATIVPFYLADNNGHRVGSMTHPTESNVKKETNGTEFGLRVSPLSGSSSLSPAGAPAVAAAGVSSLDQHVSTVYRSLVRPASQAREGDADHKDHPAQHPPPSTARLSSLQSPLPTSQRTSASRPQTLRSSGEPGDRAAAAALWSTVDEYPAEEKAEEEEITEGGLPQPVVSIGDATHQQRHSTSLASDLSSPLPVRPACHAPQDNHNADGDLDDEDEEAHLRYDIAGESSAAEEASGRPTWQRETLSNGLFECDDDDDEAEEDDAHTSTEEMLQRAEGKNAVLRLELATAANRAAAAEDALQASNEECAELHALVDRLQSELAAVHAATLVLPTPSATPMDAGVSPCLTRVDAVIQTDASALISPMEEGTPVASRHLSGPLRVCEDEWHRRHESVVQELAVVKSSMAEQLAVLDRLGLSPPFAEDVVAAAQRRLRRVKVVNAAPANGAAAVVGSSVAASEAVAAGAAPTKMRVGDNNTILTLLTQRKQQQQQRQQEATMQTGAKLATSRAASFSDSTRNAMSAKENIYGV